METQTQLPDAPAVRGGGPATSEGRRVTRHNSKVHGFSDRRAVISCLGESEEEYQALVEAFLDEYRPATATERLLVCELVTNR